MGVTRVGELLRLPRAGMARRFGRAASSISISPGAAGRAAPRRSCRAGVFASAAISRPRSQAVVYSEGAEPLVGRCASSCASDRRVSMGLELRLRHRARPATRLRVGLASVTSEHRRLTEVLRPATVSISACACSGPRHGTRSGRPAAALGRFARCLRRVGGAAAAIRRRNWSSVCAPGSAKPRLWVARPRASARGGLAAVRPARRPPSGGEGAAPPELRAAAVAAGGALAARRPQRPAAPRRCAQARVGTGAHRERLVDGQGRAARLLRRAQPGRRAAVDLPRARRRRLVPARRVRLMAGAAPAAPGYAELHALSNFSSPARRLAPGGAHRARRGTRLRVARAHRRVLLRGPRARARRRAAAALPADRGAS